MSDTPEKVEGIIESVVYANEENGYTVVEISTTDGAACTVVGSLPFAAPGERIEVEGVFTNHPTYGTQFKASVIVRTLPSSAMGILKYLAFGAVKGIGPATARRIVDKFGDNTFDILENEPEKLAEISGITPKRAAMIGNAFSVQASVRGLVEFLSSNGLEPSVAMLLFKRFGRDALDHVLSNPYILCEEPFLVDFFKTDKLALDLGFEDASFERIAAGILFELSYNTNEGHCFLPADKLIGAAVQLLSVEPEQTADVLEKLVETRRLVSDDLAGIRAVYLPQLYEAETFTAQRMAFLARRRFTDMRDAGGLIDQLQTELHIEYAKKQRDAIVLAVSNGLMILTGGPGTGKTTIVRAMLALFEHAGAKCALTAPTGRAAKRLGEVCGREAKTIHRLLEVGFGEGGMRFLRNIENPLDADVIIVDELSMVDVPLMASLLAAVKNGSRLILVGDADQLPPVGPGCVLRDLLNSGIIPFVHLDEIFRQAQESAIIVGAHKVNRGELLHIDNKQKDFFILRRNTPAQTIDTIVDLCKNRLPGKMGYDPSQIQVLSPTRKAGAGIEQLNIRLQEAVNPPSVKKKERRCGIFTIREGDRVMQIKNNYDIPWKRSDNGETGLGIFNGDIGTVEAISSLSETVTITFDDRTAVYDYEMLNELELAYAATVHKAQGSEYPVVILALCLKHSRLLTRSLLYTAMTRAREMLIIVGQEETVNDMISHDIRQRRYSGLRLRLIQLDNGA